MTEKSDLKELREHKFVLKIKNERLKTWRKEALQQEERKTESDARLELQETTMKRD